MSGICGLVPLDGAPVDREGLRALTAALAFRGPDRQASRVVEGAGLGHAWLRTDAEATADEQPLSFDGATWIVADARVDAQKALRGELAARGRVVDPACTDAALILHAWHAWGADCVRHLLGDFAFAIWDGARRSLFCARDPFGVKSLFHARVGSVLAFSNTLEALRAHPGVASRLDESVIGDFLLFEESRDPAATAFAGIRRLPPASCLLVEGDSLGTWTYWDLPADPVVRPRRGVECVEEFGALLREAVADRLRTRRVSIHMSGGLDSTALAAIAKHALAARGPHEIGAHAIVYDRLFPDGERRYAEAAASHLGVPLHCLPGDGYELFAGGDFAGRFSEPFHAPDVEALFRDSLAASARGARVLLSGYDGDALLEEPPRPYLARLWRQRRLPRLAGALLRHAFGERRLMPRARGGTPAAAPPPFPSWIEPGFARRLDLRSRWERNGPSAFGAASVRPRALRDLDGLRRSPLFFERYDPGVTRLALECRHPFLDRRLVEFCLALEPIPWCVHKRVLREAMRGLLPELVRLRPKTPLARWPGGILQARERDAGRERLEPSETLAPYVDVERARMEARSGDPLIAWRALRPVTLDRWIAQALRLPDSKRRVRP